MNDMGGFPASVITPWRSEPLNITATATNPTNGTIVSDKIYWRRVGDSMEIRIDYEQSSGGGAGSGSYLFLIPSGQSIDSANCRFYTGAAGGVASVGAGMVTDQATYKKSVLVMPYDATHVRLDDYVAGFTSSGNNPLTQTKWTMTAFFTVPISGW